MQNKGSPKLVFTHAVSRWMDVFDEVVQEKGLESSLKLDLFFFFFLLLLVKQEVRVAIGSSLVQLLYTLFDCLDFPILA